MVPMKPESKMLEQVESRIGYTFSDKALLLEAMTHRSFARDERLKNDNVVSQNERLEFLGDSILSMVTALELFRNSKRADEGAMTQLRAIYVCESHLASGARKAGLGSFIRVSPSMRRGNEVELPSLLCDVVEALIGAVYLDAGFEAARAVVLHLLGPVPEKIVAAKKDAKTDLQEWTQAKFGLTPIYKVTEALGPPHSPVFTVEVYVGDRKLATGKGASKKDAAQDAAKVAMQQIK